MNRAGDPLPYLARASAAALLGFAALAGLFRVRAYDVFWHLATGRWIVEHGQLPGADPFRFTSNGAPWVDHEWLFQVVAYTVERLGGVPALILSRSALAVALAGLLLGGIRRAGVPVGWGVPVVLAAVLGARPRMFLRPELVTMVALALLLFLLQDYRRSPPGKARLARAAAMVALVAVWANAHPGSLAAPPVAFAFLLGARLPGGHGLPRRGASPPSWATVVGLPLVLGAALLANPYGAAIVLVPAAISASLARIPGVNPEWLPLWHPTIAQDSVYLFVMALALAVLAAVTLRRTSRLDGASGLTALLVGGLATTSIRHQALFYVAATFFAGECLAQWAAREESRPAVAEGPEPSPDRRTQETRVAALGIVLCILASLWVLLPPSRGPLAPRQGRYSTGIGLAPGRYPVDLAAAVEAGWPDLGHLYNEVPWGGYLIWRLYPPRQAFVDGRNEVDPEILREMAALRRRNEARQRIFRRYDVDGAVVAYQDRLIRVVDRGPTGDPVITRRSLNAVLFPPDEFALVFWDDTGMLFVRRTPERAERLAREEYRHLQPEDWQWTLEQAGQSASFREAALAEAERRLREDPPSQRARELMQALDDL